MNGDTPPTLEPKDAADRPARTRFAVRTILIGAILVASAGMAVWLAGSPPQKTIPMELQAVLRPEPKALTDFRLAAGPTGQPFTLERLKGKWTLLFFGYTYCPDICPTALATLSAVFRKLDQYPDVIKDTQVVFVSVDPGRDRPERLAEYVAYFDERFSAVTGEVQEIDNLAHQIGAGYQIEPADSSGNYLVSHTGSVFIVDPQARLVGAFSFPHNVETIVGQFLKIREL